MAPKQVAAKQMQGPNLLSKKKARTKAFQRLPFASTWDFFSIFA